MKKIQIAATLALALVAKPAAGLASVDGPTCYRVSGNRCIISFNSVSASDASLIFLRLSIDSDVVAQSTAFFVSSVTIDGGRFGAGFRVKCGKLGESGNAAMGLKHTLSIDPLDSSSNSLGASTANIFCPAR
jgi:hypothetical protein